MNLLQPIPKEDICITGIGVATPLGNDLETFGKNLFHGRSAIKEIDHFDTTNLDCKVGSVICPLPIPAKLTQPELRKFSKLSCLSLFCTQRAWEQAGLRDDKIDPDRTGVILGSGFGNLFDLEPVYEKFYSNPSRRPPPLTIPINTNSAPATSISRFFKLRGIVQTISTACSSGSNAILNAMELIRSGQQDIMITGGADLLTCRSIFTCWEQLRILAKTNDGTQKKCRPFDRNRTGLLLGDGAAFFILEKLEKARERGANIIAVLRGGCQMTDTFDMVKPDIAGEVACIENSLKNSGLQREELGLIHCHGTGTLLNDSVEVEAMEKVLGNSLTEIPLCAIKSMIGHTMGASGPLSLAAAIHSFSTGYIYPQPNITEFDEGVTLNITNYGYLDHNLKNIMVNAFGFGGFNTSIIVSRY